MIVDKADYLDRTENLLNDTMKFEKINLKNNWILNFQRVNSILKKLVASNSLEISQTSFDQARYNVWTL